MKQLLSYRCQLIKRSLKKYINFIVSIGTFISILIGTICFYFYLNINTFNLLFITTILLVVANILCHINNIINKINKNILKQLWYKTHVSQECEFILALCSTIIAIHSGVYLTSLCFNAEAEEPFLKCLQFIVVMLFFIYVLMIIYYIKQIINLWKMDFPVVKRVYLFIYAFVQIVLFFANIYIILIFKDSNALNFVDEISKDNPTFYFEVAYFSAMTFITSGCDISPATIPAKVVVMIESLIFSVGISVVIISLIDRGRNQGRNSFSKRSPIWRKSKSFAAYRRRNRVRIHHSRRSTRQK